MIARCRIQYLTPPHITLHVAPVKTCTYSLAYLPLEIPVASSTEHTRSKTQNVC